MIPRKSPTTPTTTHKATATPRIARAVITIPRAKVAVKRGLVPRPATPSLRMLKNHQVRPAGKRGLLPHPATSSFQMRKRRQVRSLRLKTARLRGTREKCHCNIQLMRLLLKPLRRKRITRLRRRKPAPMILEQRRRSLHLRLYGELFVNLPITILILQALPMLDLVGHDTNNAS